MRNLIVIVFLFFTSCELIVDVDVPYDGDKVVVNALQRPDSTWYVNLTLTRSIVGPEFYSYEPVREANVVIHNSDGSTEALVHEQEGIFRGISYPQPGQTYRITVDANRFGAVEAELKMPEVVPIVDVKWDSANMETGGGGFYTNVSFTVTFKDPVGVKNHYAVQVYMSTAATYYQDENGNPVMDTLEQIRECAIRDDPALASEDERKLYFPDTSFDGQTYTGHFNNQFGLNRGADERIVEIKVLLLSMSEESYRYLETRKLQDDLEGDPFAQPVPVYSNISNGFGIFSGNSIDSHTWKR